MYTSSSYSSNSHSSRLCSSRLTIACAGTGSPCSFNVLYTSRRSSKECCHRSELGTNGCVICAYSDAFASGNPSEKNAINASTRGQSSIGEFKTQSSPKTETVMSPLASSRLRIAVIGFDRAFLSIAHSPTRTAPCAWRCASAIAAGCGVLALRSAPPSSGPGLAASCAIAATLSTLYSLWATGGSEIVTSTTDEELFGLSAAAARSLAFMVCTSHLSLGFQQSSFFADRSSNED